MGKRKVLEMKGLLGSLCLKRENWVALGAAAERTSRALLPLRTINQEGNTNLEHVGNSGDGLCLLIQLLVLALTLNAESKTSYSRG